MLTLTNQNISTVLSTESVGNLSTPSAYILTLLSEVLVLNEADRAAEEARRREREDAMALLGYGP